MNFIFIKSLLRKKMKKKKIYKHLDLSCCCKDAKNLDIILAICQIEMSHTQLLYWGIVILNNIFMYLVGL